MSSRRRAVGRFVTFVFSLLFVVTSRSASAAPHYPEGRIQSPMTEVVAHLQSVLGKNSGRRDTFIKVGDSNTASPSFLRCFANHDVRFGDHAELETTRAFFGVHKVDVIHDSFARISVAATPGWATAQVLGGTPSHLATEIAEVKPGFAMVMLGTNDNRPSGFEIFRDKLAEVVDRTLATGVVPILSTLPPRDDAPATSARVATFNAEIRSLAERRAIPLIDLNLALASVADHGLAKDGVHLAPAGSADGSPHACWFTSDALKKGANVRNLETLVALDRARRFVLENATPEADPTSGA